MADTSIEALFDKSWKGEVANHQCRPAAGATWRPLPFKTLACQTTGVVLAEREAAEVERENLEF